jgi:plastocyanin
MVAGLLVAGTVAAADTVAIKDFVYQPPASTVTVGHDVTWGNAAAEPPHTATADDGSWDAGALQAGQSKTLKFEEAGGYPYHCMIHPTMRGMLWSRRCRPCTSRPHPPRPALPRTAPWSSPSGGLGVGLFFARRRLAQVP